MSNQLTNIKSHGFTPLPPQPSPPFQTSSYKLFYFNESSILSRGIARGFLSYQLLTSHRIVVTLNMFISRV